MLQLYLTGDRLSKKYLKLLNVLHIEMAKIQENCIIFVECCYLFIYCYLSSVL